MPIINSKGEDVLAVPRQEALEPLTRSVETSTLVKDFLKTENGLFNAAEGLGSLMFDKFEPQEGYIPEDDMSGYEGYVNDLRGARSPEHMAHLKNKIDEENKARENYALGTGWQKAAGFGALVATDPLSWVPVGGTAYQTYRTSGNILKGATKTAGVGFAFETLNEAALQANQVTRTGEETLMNVSAATVLSGILGGAVAGLSKADFDNMAKLLENDMQVPTETKLSSAGAMQAGTTLEQEAVEGLKKTKAVYDKLPPFMKNPVMTSALSQSKATRQITENLANLSLWKNKNAEFISNNPSVELMVKGYDRLMVPFAKAESRLWKQYIERAKKGLPQDQRIGSGKDGMLTRQEFNEQVWYAGIKNDTHIIPEVQEYAQTARKEVFDPVLNRSKEVGIFDDVDELEVSTAESWMKRMFDRDKIIGDRINFKRIVLDDLKEARATSKNQLDELLAEAEIEPEFFDNLQSLQKERAQFKKENLKAINRGDDDLINKLDEFDRKIDEMAASYPDKKIVKEIQKLIYRSDQLDAELDQIAEQLIDRITNSTGGRLSYDMTLRSEKSGAPPKLGRRGSAKARVWNIRDEKIADYLVKDVRAIVSSHVKTMAPDNELMAKFKTLDVDVVKKEIQDDYNRIRNAKVKDKKTGEMRPKNNKELRDIDRQMKTDLDNVQAMWEKLRGIYAQPDDYAAPQHVLERTALGWNFVRLLGDVVASSVPDIGRAIMVHGFDKSYGKVMKSLITDIKGLKMSMDEIKELGTALDIVNSMTALRRMNMDEYIPMTGKIDNINQAVTSFSSTAFGVNHWNAAQKTLAGVMTQNRMLDAIIDFSNGKKLKPKEIKNLASHGIDKEMAGRIAKQFKDYGETRDVLKIANARTWDDIEAKDALQLAVIKQVDEIIVTPGLDRPLWMSRPGWRTIGQFKSFSFASTQRVAMAGLQQADASTFAGMSSMVMLGSLVYAYKTLVAGRDLSDDPRVWIAEGVDRSGVTGIFMDVNNIVEKVTRGTVGVNSLLGGPPMSRYASRNVTGALLGPSFGMAQDIFQMTGAFTSGDFAKSDVHAARRLLPLQNAPVFRQMFDQVEQGINSTFGIE